MMQKPKETKARSHGRSTRATAAGVEYKATKQSIAERDKWPNTKMEPRYRKNRRSVTDAKMSDTLQEIVLTAQTRPPILSLSECATMKQRWMHAQTAVELA